jgi:hypothetical protein
MLDLFIHLALQNVLFNFLLSWVLVGDLFLPIPIGTLHRDC